MTADLFLYQELAKAIIVQATTDWRTGDEDMKAEVEEFLLSDRFTDLTNVAGSYILSQLKKGY